MCFHKWGANICLNIFCSTALRFKGGLTWSQTLRALSRLQCRSSKIAQGPVRDGVVIIVIVIGIVIVTAMEMEMATELGIVIVLVIVLAIALAIALGVTCKSKNTVPFRLLIFWILFSSPDFCGSSLRPWNAGLAKLAPVAIWKNEPRYLSVLEHTMLCGPLQIATLNPKPPRQCLPD